MRAMRLVRDTLGDSRGMALLLEALERQAGKSSGIIAGEKLQAMLALNDRVSTTPGSAESLLARRQEFL